MRKPVLDRLALFECKTVTADPVYGTEVVTWAPLAYMPGSPAVAEKFHVEILDTMPSRSEAVQSGLHVTRNTTRLRMRWRNDIDSEQRVTVYGDSDQIYQIIGGPAEIFGRKQYIEMVLERYSTETS